MATLDILSALEEEFPPSRQVNIEGWPAPVWVWRFDIEVMRELATIAGDETDQALWLVRKGIGDEKEPGVFDNDRGIAWLRRNPHALTELGSIVADFNEVGGPSEDRRKKSEDSADSSSSAETSESDTQDESL